MKTLKNVFVLTLILVATLSCKKDDKDDASIVGKWKFTTQTLNGETNSELFICDFLTTLEFDEETVKSEDYSDPSGDDGSNCVLDFELTSDYSIDGDHLTVVFEGTTVTVEIDKLSSTTLKIKSEDNGSGEVDVFVTTYTRQ